ncbi:MAG: YD repeat protein, partial [Acidimicrobiaceae bacterium]
NGATYRSDGVQVGTYAGVSLTGGVPVPIVVTYAEGAVLSHVELYAGTATSSLAIVPSDWLSPDARILPAGWTLDTGAGQAAEYVSARVEANQVVLTRVDGDAVGFEKSVTGAGFTAPAGEADHVTIVPADGSVQVVADDGGVYRFLTTGQLDTYTPPTDSGIATTPMPSFVSLAVGSTAQRLVSLTDPVSTKALLYGYHGSVGTACPVSPPGFLAANDSKLTGLLCVVQRPGGGQTQLFYLADNGGVGVVRLARVVNPGNQIADFGWGTNTGATKVSLTTVRTPFLADLVSAGKISASELWTLNYTSNKIASVVAPIASGPPTTTREGITFTWSSTTETTVKVNNLDALYGTAAWDRRVNFDEHARWTADWNARGTTVNGSNTNSLERTAIWDTVTGADLMLSSRDHGRLTTYIYDIRNWLTDTYGPAPDSCFNTTTRIPTGTCLTPPVAHTRTDYDTTLGAAGSQTAMRGLAATNWSTNNFTGKPSSVGTVAASGNLSLSWGAGAPAGVTVANDWSTRMTGEINLPVAGTWGFWITMVDASDSAALYIDDKPAIVLQSGAYWGPSWYVSYGTVAGTLTAGVHRIRLDYVDSTGDALVQLNWDQPGVGNQVVTATALGPRYGLATRVTVDDSNGAPATVTHTRFDQNGWDPAYGLATSMVVDPAGAALATSTTYETGLRRRAGRSLPAGNTTTYAYYGNTETSTAITCADGSTIAAGVNQGGLPKTSTSPTPAAGVAVSYTTVYDVIGRPVASRTGTDPWTCTVYDGRGRATRISYPANATAPARNVDTVYSDTVNPQQVVVSDPAGSITTLTDFLGRPTAYTDATGATNTTSTVYDIAGRVTRRYGTMIGATAASGGLEYSYDRGGFVTQVRLDSQPVANPTYSPGVLGGELDSVAYPAGAGNAGNATSGTFTRNSAGALTAVVWAGPGGMITSDAVTRSQTGRIIDQSVDGTDPYGAGNNYVYDSAGRLASARTPGGGFYEYAYTPTGGCGANTAAGANSNRTTAKLNGATVASYCYDNADRLTSTTQAGYSTPIVYDTHGNTVQIAGQTLTYDYTNRHIGSYAPNATAPTSSVVYQRDAAGRIVSRTTTGTGASTTRYGFCGAGDGPCVTMDATNTILERTVGLPGGTGLTIRGGSTARDGGGVQLDGDRDHRPSP